MTQMKAFYYKKLLKFINTMSFNIIFVVIIY